jgi:hypothetical protein
MTNDTRSPKEIEREIEAQRSNLASNLKDLQDTFSIDTVLRQISDQVRGHGGDMARSISEQVKANPIPLALTGIGLTWMMFGNVQKQAVPSRADDDNGDDRYSDAEHDFRRTRQEQGRPYVAPTSYAPSRNNGPSWSHDDDVDGPSMVDKISSGAASVRDGAAQRASAIKDDASATAASVSEAASKAGSKVSDAAHSVQDGLAKTGNRLAEGTENLTEQGRRRVIAARQKAVDLRRQTARSAQDGADAAAAFYDRQPLVVGALALAVGAAFGGAFPRTKAEDDLLGSRSDDLIHHAERIFEDEKAKAISVAQSVKDDVMESAAELDREPPT